MSFISFHPFMFPADLIIILPGWFHALNNFASTHSQLNDVVHVHLHNASHGQLVQDGEVHEVHAGLLLHNASHSVLHLNSSTAGLHRDVLVSGGEEGGTGGR